MSARSLAAAVLSAVALAVCAAPAPALTLQPPSLEDCGDSTFGQPFLPWGDPMQYVFVRNGGLELTYPAWKRSAGATVVTGNEDAYVHAATDTRSLSLAEGATATTPTTCMGLNRPTVRFFLRRTSTDLDDAAALLKVEVIFSDVTGVTRTLPVGLLPAATSWLPSPPVFIGADPLPEAATSPRVAFRFTAIGGPFAVDDVYVDPYGKR
jgi:hypothetical protein